MSSIILANVARHKKMQDYLVTGAAGFIGFHLAEQLLRQGKTVVGVDNLNDYYSVQLKKDRLRQLEAHDNFRFELLDLADREQTAHLFEDLSFEIVLHMAAQAGVRYSLENPHAYVDSNLTAFVNVLEGCRSGQVKHLVYASSSSVYGANKKVPFSVNDSVDHPISLYAATKKSNELMAHCYSHLYGLPVTGLRFFTVYGPWGRPDMALYRFVDAITRGRPIDVYNHGKMKRDFTYIDDIVRGVLLVAEQIPTLNSRVEKGDRSESSEVPYRLHNIGNCQPLELEAVIEVLEKCLGRKATKNYLPMQPGDVVETFADINSLQQSVGFCPATTFEVGASKFVDWYREYYL